MVKLIKATNYSMIWLSPLARHNSFRSLELFACIMKAETTPSCERAHFNCARFGGRNSNNEYLMSCSANDNTEWGLFESNEMGFYGHFKWSYTVSIIIFSCKYNNGYWKMTKFKGVHPKFLISCCYKHWFIGGRQQSQIFVLNSIENLFTQNH